MKYLAFILTLLLFSCAKEGKNIYIEGRVVNPVTGEGIPNIRMELWKTVGDITGSGANYKIVREVISDENGNFVLAHNGSLFNSYSVRTVDIDEVGYHYVGWKDENGNLISQYSLPVTKTKYQNVNLELVPYANVSYSFNNVNCYDSTDSLSFLAWDNYETYIMSPWIHVGCVNFQGSYDKVPMGITYYSYTLIRNGITTYYSDTFFLNSGEYKNFILDY